MKKCNACSIEVGGAFKSCPLCQNHLTGENTINNWPTPGKLKFRAFAYKLQLFIVLAIVVVSLCLDFLMDIDFSVMKHWSLILSAWIIIAEIAVHGFLKKSVVIARIISVSVFYVCLLLILTAWYYNFLHVVVYLAVPAIFSVSLIANFVFALIDKTENAMVYLLANILGGVIPYIVLVVSKRVRTYSWTICLMISIITFLGIAIFKGRKVWLEIQKRMNI